MAILVGILLGLGRLAADSEITAMRASGMGALDFVRIVSIVSAVQGWGSGSWSIRSLSRRQGLQHRFSSLEKLTEDSTQASFEVQPRVFYEDFKNYVLYVQNVKPASNGAAVWQHVFLADLTEPDLATHHDGEQCALVINESAAAECDPPLPEPPMVPSVRLHLLDGTQHQVSALKSDAVRHLDLRDDGYSDPDRNAG